MNAAHADVAAVARRGEHAAGPSARGPAAAGPEPLVAPSWLRAADAPARMRTMSHLQRTVGGRAAASVIASIQRDDPSPVPVGSAPTSAVPAGTTAASTASTTPPEASTRTEPTRVIDYLGQRHEIRESEWPAFVSGLKRHFTAQVVQPLAMRMDSARYLYDEMSRLNNDQWAVAWMLEATRSGINLDEITEPILIAEDAMRSLRTALAGDDLVATLASARVAERQVQTAYSMIHRYRDLQIRSGETAVLTLEVTATVCFTIFALAGGAVLAAPVAAGGFGLGALSSGAIAGGATALLSSAAATGGRAVAGEDIGAEDLGNVMIDTAVGAAGGAVGAGVAARLAPYLGPALARSLRARGLFTSVSEVVLTTELRNVLTGSAAGMVQGAIADGIRVLRGQGTMQQLLRNVVVNLVAGGIVGFLGGRLPVRTGLPARGVAPAAGGPPAGSGPISEPPAAGPRVPEADGPPTVRPPPAERATAPSDGDRPMLPPEPATPAPARLQDASRPDFYAVSDSTNPRLQATGRVDSEGSLTMTIRAVAPDGTRSTVIEGSSQFRAILQFFGSRVQAIRGSWSYGTNLGRVNELTSGGMPLEQAAQQTWTGGQATSAGYANVRVVHSEGSPGNYSKVEVLFTR